jgi:hypothetical protein
VTTLIKGRRPARYFRPHRTTFEVSPMERRTLQQTIDDMRNYIRHKTATGFHAAKDIESTVLEVFCDDQEPEVLRPIAERLTREAIEKQLAAQKEWPAVTDCDLLDRAFTELERAGIVARQDFTCCGT